MLNLVNVLFLIFIQRVVRKHQLASNIRREIQRFLAGFAMAKK
jgi:hypothetical protein